MVFGTVAKTGKASDGVPFGQPVHGNGSIDLLDATPPPKEIDFVPSPADAALKKDYTPPTQLDGTQSLTKTETSPTNASDLTSTTLDAPVSSFNSAKAWASAHKRGLAVGAGVVALGGIAAYGLSNRGDADAPAGTDAVRGTPTVAGTQSANYAVTGEQASGVGSSFGTINQTAGYGGIPSGYVGGYVGGSSLVSSAYTNELKEAQALIATSNINKSRQEAQSFSGHFGASPQASITTSPVTDSAVTSGKIVYS